MVYKDKKQTEVRLVYSVLVMPEVTVPLPQSLMEFDKVECASTKTGHHPESVRKQLQELNISPAVIAASAKTPLLNEAAMRTL